MAYVIPAKSVVLFPFYPLHAMCLFSTTHRLPWKIFLFIIAFHQLFIVCPGVLFFVFILLGVWLVCAWIYSIHCYIHQKNFHVKYVVIYLF